MTRLFLVLWMLGALACPARSDELRPGYLEIRQTASDIYSLLFKIPAMGDDLRLGIYVALPEGTYDTAPPRSAFGNGVYVERRTIRREGGLTGHSIVIQGLSATSTEVLARVETLGGAVQTERMAPTRTSFVGSMPTQPSPGSHASHHACDCDSFPGRWM